MFDVIEVVVNSFANLLEFVNIEVDEAMVLHE